MPLYLIRRTCASAHKKNKKRLRERKKNEWRGGGPTYHQIGVVEFDGDGPHGVRNGGTQRGSADLQAAVAIRRRHGTAFRAFERVEFFGQSCLARVEQYVQTVERQRDIMPRRKQELLDFIFFGGDFSRGLDGHDHRTVHHHVHIGRETK
jgi:hypothetical protein